MRSDQAEIKLKIEGSLTLMLGRPWYPAFFFVVPVDAPSNPSLRDLLVAPDRLFNTELMIVFVCARSRRRVKYDGEDELTFNVQCAQRARRKIPRHSERFLDALWPHHQALSAVFLKDALKRTTGVSLSDLAPPRRGVGHFNFKRERCGELRE